MTEPTTPTGKRLSEGLDPDSVEGRWLIVPILAIEREAAQQERERLRALIDPEAESIENTAERDVVIDCATRIRDALVEPAP